MKVNSRVFTERTDLLGGIQIPNCPSQIRPIAERLIMMITKPGYSPPNYNTVSELDKNLMMDFWEEYDGLSAITDLRKWFVCSATFPDLITRARRWLTEHQYIFLKADVIERAYEAQAKFSKAVGGKG